MRLERLTKGQVEDIYKNKMTVDFPKSELKPLDAILKAIDKDIYEPLGLVSGVLSYSVAQGNV
ncbi:MAG: hypothetical protein J6O61_01740 [Butyrivibrio sp.]|uniref:hypothetical protein n=1 Tax=Butyrivibrio sp. TaxID=28121 RepID=UPI001B0D11F9|nr:hypothetical protein [Butyrivibrio sp.]MBO6239556.1 hypothetical protein [Butyrivibrio sp.]